MPTNTFILLRDYNNTSDRRPLPSLTLKPYHLFASGMTCFGSSETGPADSLDWVDSIALITSCAVIRSGSCLMSLVSARFAEAKKSEVRRPRSCEGSAAWIAPGFPRF